MTFKSKKINTLVNYQETKKNIHALRNPDEGGGDRPEFI